MCDTFASIGDAGTLFAKSSDRPVGEVQLVEHHPRRPSGPALRSQYLDLGADPGAASCTGSRPAWLWGLEHGVNEWGVAIGNEKVWTTDDPRGRPAALLGMDLVRLGLERARTADDALDVITTLVEAHGQGGSGEQDHDEPYHSSFLIADAHQAWVLETSDRTWAARRVERGGAAISNRITLRTEHDRRSANVPADADFDTWRARAVPTGLADHRLAVTAACASAAPTPVDAVVALRSHGGQPWGAPDGSGQQTPEAIPPDLGNDFDGVTVCMHVRDYQVTTASMVALLPHADSPVRLWACLGSPCVGIYVPLLVGAVPTELGDATVWSHFDALRRAAEADPAMAAMIRTRLGPLEADAWTAADVRVTAGDLDPDRWATVAAGTVRRALDATGALLV